MDLKTRYVIKGIGMEQTIESKVTITVGPDGKIAKVEDKWNGKLPESGFANVSGLSDLVNPFWWEKYAEGWLFWGWSFLWYTWPWMVRLVAPFLCWFRPTLLQISNGGMESSWRRKLRTTDRFHLQFFRRTPADSS